MGAETSRERIFEKGPGDEVRPSDPFDAWPALRDQAVQSYLCHDLAEENSVPYEVLEPVLRHHLMQCGLMEFICRFSKKNGKLDTKEIKPHLSSRKLSLDRGLTLDGWKDLCRCWIERVAEAQMEDVLTWQKQMQYLQQERVDRYSKSMQLFQKEYVLNLESYYKSVTEECRKEQAERDKWEKSQKIQEDFYADQMGFCQKANDEAIEIWNQTLSKQKTAAQQYIEHLAPKRISENKITFSYHLPDGMVGPISAGCPPLELRRRNKGRA